jgi:hypothetical protein
MVKTAIKEETIKLAQYLRDEKTDYEPLQLASFCNKKKKSIELAGASE